MENSKLLLFAMIGTVAVAIGIFAYSVGARPPKAATAVLFKEELVPPPPPLPPQPKREKPKAPTCADGAMQGGFCVIK